MKRYHGIIPPMVTPLKERDELDVAGLERLIEHMLAGGVHGLFVLGTNGEGPGLSHRLKREVVERVCRQVAGRVPIFVGITDTSFVESVNLARFSSEAGASAAVLAPPFYFSASQVELFEYLEHMTRELPLPLMLYNLPSLTKLVLEPDTVRRAMELPGVVGVKDSSADMLYFHQLQLLRRERPDFSLLVGPEGLLGEAVLLGADGGVSGGANVFPELYVALYDAAVNGRRDRVAQLHDAVMRIGLSLFSVGQYGSSFLKCLKCALALEGVCNDFMCEPFRRFKEAERKRMAMHLQESKLLLEAVIQDA